MLATLAGVTNRKLASTRGHYRPPSDKNMPRARALFTSQPRKEALAMAAWPPRPARMDRWMDPLGSLHLSFTSRCYRSKACSELSRLPNEAPSGHKSAPFPRIECGQPHFVVLPGWPQTSR